MNHYELIFAIRTLLLRPQRLDYLALAQVNQPSDLADALEEHDVIRTTPLLLTLQPREQAALFIHFSPSYQDALSSTLPRPALFNLFEQLPADDRADVFNRLDAELQAASLASLASSQRDDVMHLAGYPDGTAGAAMTSAYVAVSGDLTVAQALIHLRTSAPDSETIYVLYVVDAGRRLQGTVSLRQLVLADPGTPLSTLTHDYPVHAQADQAATDAVALIQRYDLLAIPVLDDAGRMLGIVTVDDAMDLGKDDDTARFVRFGGITADASADLDVLRTPLRRMFSVRLFWLAVLTVFGIITSTFVANQEELLTQAIVLAAFIAPIVDMGGNTGSQSATLVIRSMALGDLGSHWRQVATVIRREVPVALGLGITIALLEIVLAWFSKGVGMDILLVVGLSMLVCTALGGMIGALLPVAARRIGADPATLSAPLITSIMDLLGVFIYFGFAWLLLGDTLRAAGS